MVLDVTPGLQSVTFILGKRLVTRVFCIQVSTWALGRGVSGFLLWQVLGGAPIAISISQDCPSFACLISRSSDNEDRPERKARNRTELLEAA